MHSHAQTPTQMRTHTRGCTRALARAHACRSSSQRWKGTARMARLYPWPHSLTPTDYNSPSFCSPLLLTFFAPQHPVLRECVLAPMSMRGCACADASAPMLACENWTCVHTRQHVFAHADFCFHWTLAPFRDRTFSRDSPRKS
eukprot:6195006-Pleurochrysis_carterae.AAC.1